MNDINEYKRIWKETFMDNDNYIKIVFDTYYNNSYIYYKKINNNIVSAMMCVPYCVGDTSCNDASKNDILSKINDVEKINKEDNKNEIDISLKLNAAYQCGLATLPIYRNKGYMSELITKANKELLNNNFSLAFLIPSDEEKRIYYSKFGYVNTTYIDIQRYNYMHTFISDIKVNSSQNSSYKEVYVRDELYYKLYDINDIVNIRKYENNKSQDAIPESIYYMYTKLISDISGMHVCHTLKDFKTICIENSISGGKILFITNLNNKPIGMLFCSNIGEGEAAIRLLVSESEEADLVLLQVLKSLLPPDTSLSVYSYNLRNRVDCNQAIYKPYAIVSEDSDEVSSTISSVKSHISVQAAINNVIPYAMVKILNVAEVLKFVATLYKDAKFSILIKHDEFKENEGLYSISNGMMTFIPLAKINDNHLEQYLQKCETSLEWFNISVRELAAFLFRKTHIHSIIDEAIAIPELPFNVALMLD